MHYQAIKPYSWQQLLAGISFSLEGRLVIESGKEQVSFDFASGFEEDMWLIEISKSLYGTEVLELNLLRGQLQGAGWSRLFAGSSKEERRLLRLLGRVLRAPLSIVNKKNCVAQGVKCWQKNLGDNWQIERNSQQLVLRYADRWVQLKLFFTDWNQDHFKQFTVVINVIQTDQLRAMKLIFVSR